jgi:hypothetical protein
VPERHVEREEERREEDGDVGPRGEAAVDREKLIDVVVGLGALAAARPDVASVDVNPLIIRADGTPAEAPVVGAVNMDQITVDLTGLGAARMEDWLGCEVELISRDRRSRAHLPAVAAASGMIVHECLTRLNPRIPRSVSSAVSVSLVNGPESTVAARAGASDGPRRGSAAG